MHKPGRLGCAVYKCDKCVRVTWFCMWLTLASAHCLCVFVLCLYTFYTHWRCSWH